jgi:hypothetical protein
MVLVPSALKNPSQPDTQPVVNKTSKYQSNLIVQSSDDPIVMA